MTTPAPTPLEEALRRLRVGVDPGFVAFSGHPQELPAHWRGYLDDDPAARLDCLRAECAMLADYLPEVCTALLSTAEDAFMLNSPESGPLRCIMRRIRGVLYPTLSARPLGQAPAPNPHAQLLLTAGPDALSWIYTELMDGLTDMYDFGGLLRAARLTSMAAEIDSYGETDWFDAFSLDHDTDRVIEIFRSGGSGYLLVDLDRPGLSSNPDALLVIVDEDAPPETVSLFAWLDAWTAIALTG